MSLEGIFEQEFLKLNLRKVKLKTDPKKPLLPYEGYILGENKRFPKLCEGILSKIGRGYQKLAANSLKFKQLGQGDLSVLANKEKPKPKHNKTQLKQDDLSKIKAKPKPKHNKTQLKQDDLSKIKAKPKPKPVKKRVKPQKLTVKGTSIP